VNVAACLGGGEEGRASSGHRQAIGHSSGRSL
jgi:hypothetical protein